VSCDSGTELQKELNAIEDVARADFAALERLGFGRNERTAVAETPEQVDATAVAAGAAGQADPAPDARAAPAMGDATPSNVTPRALPPDTSSGVRPRAALEPGVRPSVFLTSVGVCSIEVWSGIDGR